MNTLAKSALRLIAVVTVAAIAGIIAEHLAAEAFVYWYMAAHGVTVRAELADDLGFGLFGFSISVSTFFVTFLLAAVFAWKGSGRIFRGSDV